jgi:uncharacterized protein (TIGR02145 family)
MNLKFFKMKTPVLTLLAFVLLFAACEKDPFEANSGTFTDERDGREYKWVKIGDQIWMAENLAYVPYVCAPDSQCGIWIYGYDGEGSYGTNYHTYGALYDWETAMEVCPEGWHLPSDQEWMELERFLGMPEDELYAYNGPRGKDENVSLKLGAGMDLWTEKNVNATNEYGFSVLPGGARYYGSPGGYRLLGDYATFWTSSYDEFNNLLWMRSIEINGIRRFNRDKGLGYSVRCIKD